MGLIGSEATTAQCSPGTTHAQQCQGEIVLHPADEGQKPETAVQGLHLLSFGTVHLSFHVYIHVRMCTCVNPGFDSSPEDSTLAAAGTQAVVVKKTKPRGRKPSLQDCDKGTANSLTDSKIQLRKKPFKTRPCDGKFY